MNVYETIIEKTAQQLKQFAVLIDPDKPTSKEIVSIAFTI